MIERHLDGFKWQIATLLIIPWGETQHCFPLPTLVPVQVRGTKQLRIDPLPCSTPLTQFSCETLRIKWHGMRRVTRLGGGNFSPERLPVLSHHVQGPAVPS